MVHPPGEPVLSRLSSCARGSNIYFELLKYSSEQRRLEEVRQLLMQRVEQIEARLAELARVMNIMKQQL